MSIFPGGERSEGKFTTTSETYDVDRDEWQRSGLIPRCRVHAVAASVGDTAYLSGGSMSGQPKDNIWSVLDMNVKNKFSKM